MIFVFNYWCMLGLIAGMLLIVDIKEFTDWDVTEFDYWMVFLFSILFGALSLLLVIPIIKHDTIKLFK